MIRLLVCKTHIFPFTAHQKYEYCKHTNTDWQVAALVSQHAPGGSLPPYKTKGVGFNFAAGLVSTVRKGGQKKANEVVSKVLGGAGAAGAAAIGEG